MNDITSLKAFFGDVQELQSKLKTRMTDVESTADKFKAAFQAAAKPGTKDTIVAALKDAVSGDSSNNSTNSTSSTSSTSSAASDLAGQIQATLAALQQQLQNKITPAPTPAASATSDAVSSVAASTVTAATAATATTAAAATTTSTTNTTNAANATTAATAVAAATSAASESTTATAATPPAPAPAIAAVNATHTPYRVYDPTNPSAFVEPTNPGGGPNLLASDLVFNPDPRPNSPLSVALPTAAYGSAEWKDQIQTYKATYEKLGADNAAWNQKNMELRKQTLLASPYAAFAGHQGQNAAAAADPYTLASAASRAAI
ncbi:hypothetical protein [Undibacterium sp. Ji49W]|uniref:hypothetical protein n=1 Tax=Undibacterium sp. Ji49W TaxID=3413040 RepID=UPI003BF16B6A